jgi:hypothetical protein
MNHFQRIAMSRDILLYLEYSIDKINHSLHILTRQLKDTRVINLICIEHQWR